MKAGKITIEWSDDATTISYITEPGVMRTFDLIAILERAKLHMWENKIEQKEEETR